MTQDDHQAQTIADQIEVLRKDIARLAELVGERASDTAEEARSAAQTIAEDARKRADVYRAEAQKKQRATTRKVKTQFVKTRRFPLAWPWARGCCWPGRSCVGFKRSVRPAKGIQRPDAAAFQPQRPFRFGVCHIPSRQGGVSIHDVTTRPYAHA